jgi:hypothetical protein
MLPEFATLIVFIPKVERVHRPEGDTMTGTVEPVGGIQWKPGEPCSIYAENDELWSLIQNRTEQLMEQGISGPAFCEQFSDGQTTYKGKRLLAMPPRHLREFAKELANETLRYEE